MLRRPSGLAAAAVAGVLVLAPAPIALAGSHGGGHGHGSTHASAKHHGKPAAKHFTAVGTVTSVDGDQLTLADKGGSRDLHGTDVTVTVPEGAHIRRGGPAELADLQAGDHVSVHGMRSEDGLVARHVHASVPDEDTTEDGTEDSTDDSTDGTVDDSTVDDGTVDDGTVDDGTVDDGTVDDGADTGTDGTTDGTGTDGTPTV